MKSFHHLFCLPGTIVLFILLHSCDAGSEDPQGGPIKITDLHGAVQKGPYLNGTTLRISELNSSLNQTGLSFNAQIQSNLGDFSLGNVELESQYVELQADGFYFNEVADETSSARLILYALSDLSDKSTLNVNLMSHLEKDRVRYLVQEGMDFQGAKTQAQGEILDIFSLETEELRASELLDISGQGEDDAVLLAISVILQGYRSVGDLSELLANIITDIKQDGQLDNPDLGSLLMNHAVILDLPAIRECLEARYAAQGLSVELPDFESFVEEYMANSDHRLTQKILYPQFSEYGENILFESLTSVTADLDYSMAADLPVGTSLSIRLSGGLWYYCAMPCSPVNWKVSAYDEDNLTQTFVATESGRSCDLQIQFAGGMENPPDTLQGALGSDSILIEFFENNALDATFSKWLRIE
jgi:hypothetical protein